MKAHWPSARLFAALLCGGAFPLSAQKTAAEEVPRAIPVEDAEAPRVSLIEDPAVLSASRFLPPDLLVGPYHRVRERVSTDGYLARYTVDSDFGSFLIVGTPQLRTCILEIDAIAKLNAVSKSDLFADGLKRSLEQPVEAVKNVVRHPGDTAKALPRTVGHFFRKVGDSIANVAENVKDRIAESGEGNRDLGDTARDMGHAIGQAGKGIMGFDTAKLECAKQLGVDPYSDNPRLQEEMEKVTWVFFSGGLPLRIGTMVTGTALAVGATTFVGLPDDIYTLTPAEITLRNKQTMSAMGVPDEVRKRFENSPALTISLRLSLLRSLGALGAARNRAQAVALAAGCETREQARFLDEILRMMAVREAKGAAKIREIRLLGRIPAAVDARGAVVLTLPVDYVSWTTEVAAFATRDDVAGLRPTVVHTGAFSPVAQEELERLGWILEKM